MVIPAGFVAAQQPILPPDTLPESIDLESVPLGQSHRPPDPPSNPTTVEKVELGRKLFFDPILSGDGKVSCASCHQPDHGFASPDPVAIGHSGQAGTRNAPSIINSGYLKSLSWDGRDASLEAQVLGPLTNPVELATDLESMISRLQADPDYVDLFSAAFPEAGEAESPPESRITVDNVTRAIASFERTLIAGDNGADRFRDRQYNALTKAARSGMWIFESRGGCWKCHSGPQLTDEKFHNTGVSHGIDDRDPGRMQVSEDPADRFRFKTPSLRNVALTPPYMHDGSLKSLRDVVEFYNRGGSPDDPGLDDQLKPLNLSEEEIGFVVEFLKALTDRPDE